jgi:hypothetical protein
MLTVRPARQAFYLPGNALAALGCYPEAIASYERVLAKIARSPGIINLDSCVIYGKDARLI